MRMLICVAALLIAPTTGAQDYRVMKLEQDVRTLERQVQTLSRQLDALQRASRSDAGASQVQKPATTSDEDPAWLSASRWNRVRDGMSEIEVVEILGKPTAVRPGTSGQRALLYTLEIGTMSFLTGSVEFDNGKVVDIQKPALK